MTFAFYLGAGNIIFPPLAGYMAGEHLSLAMLGFLVTAVGLPLITILAVAKAGNGWAGMTKLLPTGVATALAVAIYIIIGPAFAAPRTGLVAYEMGLKPFLGDMGQSGLAAGPRQCGHRRDHPQAVPQVDQAFRLWPQPV